ncbi:MAG: Crp/Fnr family transcriptional regulator [Bacteroidetes bacterium]|nr:MAG: Crp/Fnr family transcriptional regulator [Bacteroidota bacterium]
MGILEATQAVEPLSLESAKALAQIIERKSLKKGQHVLYFGEVDKYMHFMVQGAGRVYYEHDGKDITDYLALDGQFLGGVISMFTGKPSHKAIEILEDSEVESLHYPSFERLCAQYHDIERLGRKMATFAFLEAQERIESIRFHSAAERYAFLELKYPGISNRIPLKHLASYLGTTQVSLSRIRAGIQ